MDAFGTLMQSGECDHKMAATEGGTSQKINQSEFISILDQLSQLKHKPENAREWGYP